MHRVERSALVRHSADDMYQLVNDVASYPEFLKWCHSARVLNDEPKAMDAELEIAWKGLHKVFTTHNNLVPGEQIELNLVSGPFKKLQGIWDFKPLKEDACKVSMDIEFEFTNALSNTLFGTIFSQICNSLIESFVERADAVYGESL